MKAGGPDMGGSGSGGHNRKPAEHKRRLGNPGEKHLPKESEIIKLPGYSLGETPEPLRPLTQMGRAAWDQAWAAGRWWIAESDLQLLQAWCESLDDYIRWRTYAHQNPDDMEAAKRLEHTRFAFFRMAMELGLTPVARSRLSIAEVRVQEGLQRLVEPAEVVEME